MRSTTGRIRLQRVGDGAARHGGRGLDERVIEGVGARLCLRRCAGQQQRDRAWKSACMPAHQAPPAILSEARGFTPPRPLRVFYLQAEIQYHYLRERMQQIGLPPEVMAAATAVSPAALAAAASRVRAARKSLGANT